VQLEVALDGERPTQTQVACYGDLADVCAVLSEGLRVIVIGRDTLSEKQVTHLGMLLEPPQLQTSE
jgi:hypothetical protein